jgi:hypothetical protein
MAFKFKVKKRPNLAQAVTSAFTQGAVQGGQAALQQMIKDREELKQQSTKELNLYNTLTSNLSQTADNKKLQADGKLKILKGEKAEDVFTAQQSDFQYSSSVATEPIYNPDTGEVLAYTYGKNILYPPKEKTTTAPTSGITVAEKREFDLYNKRVSDQQKRIKELEDKKIVFPADFTEVDQQSLDSLKNIQLPKSLQLLQEVIDNLSGGTGVSTTTPVNQVSSESESSDDPFAQFLETGQ